MKTYLVFEKAEQGFNFIAVKTSSKKDAYRKVKDVYPNAQNRVIISGCDISLITGKKI